MIEDYLEFFQQFRAQKNTLRIFEIGGGSADLGLDDAVHAHKKIVYREIHYHFEYDTAGAQVHREPAHKRISEHQENAANKDTLSLVWNAANVPYPLPNEFFDEIHCHMITSNIVCSPRAPPDTLYSKHSLLFADWVKELARISAPHAVFFTMIQQGLFFANERGYNRPTFYDLVYELGAEFDSQGFGVQQLSFGLCLPRKDIYRFTSHERFVDATILAQKDVPCDEDLARIFETIRQEKQ